MALFPPVLPAEHFHSEMHFSSGLLKAPFLRSGRRSSGGCPEGGKEIEEKKRIFP